MILVFISSISNLEVTKFHSDIRALIAVFHKTSLTLAHDWLHNSGQTAVFYE